MTGWDRCRTWHAIGRTEALATALPTLLIAVIYQLGTAVRIDAPKGAFARLILRARYLDKIPTSGGGLQLTWYQLKTKQLSTRLPIQTEIMTYGILPALVGLLAIVWIMLDNKWINAREGQLLIRCSWYGLNNQLGIAIRRFFIVIITGCRRCLE